MDFDEYFGKWVEVTIGKIKHRGILRKGKEAILDEEYICLFNGISTIRFKKDCVTSIKLI